MHEIPNLPFPSLNQPQPSDVKAAALAEQASNDQARQEPNPAQRED